MLSDQCALDVGGGSALPRLGRLRGARWRQAGLRQGTGTRCNPAKWVCMQDTQSGWSGDQASLPRLAQRPTRWPGWMQLKLQRAPRLKR